MCILASVNFYIVIVLTLPNAVNMALVARINILVLCISTITRKVLGLLNSLLRLNLSTRVILQYSGQNLTVHKIRSTENPSILLCTTAVKVANPALGKLTVAYAQLDTASQATLICDSLKNELGLQTETDHSMTLRCIANKIVPIGGQANFKLESPSTGEQFNINDAQVVPQFSDDENI